MIKVPTVLEIGDTILMPNVKHPLTPANEHEVIGIKIVMHKGKATRIAYKIAGGHGRDEVLIQEKELRNG